MGSVSFVLPLSVTAAASIERRLVFGLNGLAVPVLFCTQTSIISLIFVSSVSTRCRPSASSVTPVSANAAAGISADAPAISAAVTGISSAANSSQSPYSGP